MCAEQEPDVKFTPRFDPLLWWEEQYFAVHAVDAKYAYMFGNLHATNPHKQYFAFQLTSESKRSSFVEQTNSGEGW